MSQHIVDTSQNPNHHCVNMDGNNHSNYDNVICDDITQGNEHLLPPVYSSSNCHTIVVNDSHINEITNNSNSLIQLQLPNYCMSEQTQLLSQSSYMSLPSPLQSPPPPPYTLPLYTTQHLPSSTTQYLPSSTTQYLPSSTTQYLPSYQECRQNSDQNEQQELYLSTREDVDAFDRRFQKHTLCLCIVVIMFIVGVILKLSNTI